jgi:hypothetical protein
MPQDPLSDEHVYAERWKNYADKVKDKLPTSDQPKEWLPSYKDFHNAASKTAGGAGFDGWHSAEVKLMVKHFEFLIVELHALWCDTAVYLVTAVFDKELQLLIMHWRVVGIPKKDPKQNRPISVCIVPLSNLADRL